jgi:hypothetical protein
LARLDSNNDRSFEGHVLHARDNMLPSRGDIFTILKAKFTTALLNLTLGGMQFVFEMLVSALSLARLPNPSTVATVSLANVDGLSGRCAPLLLVPKKTDLKQHRGPSPSTHKKGPQGSVSIFRCKRSNALDE